MENKSLLDTMILLRREEQLVLYPEDRPVSDETWQLISDFLEEEYRQECLEYPAEAPGFDPRSALWAASTLYTIAKLVLNREQKPEELKHILPGYEGNTSASAMLSADLCLRFLPRLREAVRSIDADDALLEHIDRLLSDWPYSAIGLPEVTANEHKQEAIAADVCLSALYTDRIIERKDRLVASQPLWEEKIKAAKGSSEQHP